MQLPPHHVSIAAPSCLQAAGALPFILIAGALLCGPAMAACLPAGAEMVRVTGVEDARTLRLSDGRLVRPAGIESFALIGAARGTADEILADRLSSLLAGRQAQIRIFPGAADRYGRRTALIAGDGQLLQARLALEGVAIAFPEGGGEDCIAEILAAEAAARERRTGFWRQIAVLPAEPSALSSHSGGYVIFEGTVLSVGNRTRRTYLNFGRRWSEDVTVVIESRDREGFGGAEALAGLAGQRVRVRGFAEERGGPMIGVRWPSQVEILKPLEGGGDGS